MVEYDTVKDDELLQLLVLYQQLNPGDFIDEVTAKNVWEEIKKQNIKYFVARENGKIISSCYISVIHNITRGGRSIGFIENVITDVAYRRKGIGKTVIEHAINYAKEQNCYKVVLQSGNKRSDAHSFYEKIGFDGTSKKAFEIRF